ncbi:MAG: DUF5606 domain-containing protein [Tannerellaceae bacterium]|jgi:hypothetical protein|nr:DUF5606 domain-containing protein [Tannerellaceae bacterium]
MLKTILSVSGKPGLFKLVSKGKNMLIVESLVDGKKMPTYAKNKVVSLGDISVFTDGEDVPLHIVLTSIKNRENGEKTAINPSTATPGDLRAYLAGVLPSFDRERVYPNDIRKMLVWYNLLISSGITDFAPENKTKETTQPEEEPQSDASPSGEAQNPAKDSE